MMGVCNHKVAIVGWVQSQQCDHWGLITGVAPRRCYHRDAITRVCSQGSDHRGVIMGVRSRGCPITGGGCYHGGEMTGM